ncbi:hypothetical protein LTR22_010143 [Elasticomyces elasticus]|nr:hypothetical protein LTR22_010143 [Elasticomyces elasticus]
MAPKTPEETLERYAARLAENLLASRHLVKTYQPRLYQRRKLPITGSITHSVLEKLQRVDALAHCVFNTYELLEMILLHLPMRDLLFACGVSKTFQKIINRSDPVQKALYMKPDTSELPDGQDLAFNSMLWRGYCPKYGPWRINGAGVFGSSKVELAHWLETHYFKRAKSIEKCVGYDAAGSWEKMYLTRPVPEKVMLDLYSVGDGTDSADSVYLDGPQATMGVIRDNVQRIYSNTIASDQWREYMDDTATCQCYSCQAVEQAKRIASGEEEPEEKFKQESPVLSEQIGDTSSESGSEQESEVACNEGSDEETDEEASEQDRVGAHAYEDDF